jgi:undecaprenyl-diphosphatase
MKLIVRRSRPKTIYAENMKIKSYSFPSSHTYAATLAGGYLALLCFTIFAVPINLLFGGMIVILVVAIGLSRVHVGAHYPTDVTAGWLLGVIILAIIAHSTVLFMHL